MSPSKPKTDKKRLPRTKRVARPPRFNLTPRDVELVRAVFKYRFLGTRQIWWLFPNDSQKNLTNRLRNLFQHAYLNRITLPISSSRDGMIYAMTEKGATLLAEADGVDRSEIKWARHLNVVQPTHIQHLLAINAVLIPYRATLEAAKGRVRSRTSGCTGETLRSIASRFKFAMQTGIAVMSQSFLTRFLSFNLLRAKRARSSLKWTEPL